MNDTWIFRRLCPLQTLLGIAKRDNHHHPSNYIQRLRQTRALAAAEKTCRHQSKLWQSPNATQPLPWYTDTMISFPNHPYLQIKRGNWPRPRLCNLLIRRENQRFRGAADDLPLPLSTEPKRGYNQRLVQAHQLSMASGIDWRPRRKMSKRVQKAWSGALVKV